jgi:membrane fusion protein (multidrug efflux system)
MSQDMPPRDRRMIARPTTWLLVAAMASLLSASKDERSHAATLPAGPPTEVDVVTLHEESVTLTTELPGRTSAFRVAEVRPQVGGIVLRRLFTEGEEVKAGQILFQIDPQLYQANLASADATLAHASASVVLAQETANRYRTLVKANAVSHQELETADATLQQDQADVASAQAAVKMAAINLAYTKVTSPISGHSGRSSVTEGALVTASQAIALVTVTQLNPIYVDVTQPSATILRLKRELAGGLLRSAGENQVPVKLILEDGSTYDQLGRLQFSEVTVDQGTGSVTLRAMFPNDGGLLLPGMFTRAALEEGVRRAGLLVPQQGVTHNQRGEPTAMIVNADNKVEVRGLTTDRAIGDKWLVTAGVAHGDKVIVSGLQKIKSGERVTVRDVTAAFYPAPAATHAAREDP